MGTEGDFRTIERSAPPAGYRLSRDAREVDVDRVHRWLAEESYWAQGREREVIERSLAGSRPYAVLRDGEQCAFARAVTDAATFAWICDVFVDSAHRGRGLGTWLVESIVADLSALGVSRFLLGTKDAHEVYRRVGFTPLARTGRWMELTRRAPEQPGDSGDDRDTGGEQTFESVGGPR